MVDWGHIIEAASNKKVDELDFNPLIIFYFGVVKKRFHNFLVNELSFEAFEMSSLSELVLLCLFFIFFLFFLLQFSTIKLSYVPS